MRYKKLKEVREAIVILSEAMVELSDESREAEDVEGAFELAEICADLWSPLERLIKFDVNVAERKLNGEKRVDKPITVN